MKVKSVILLIVALAVCQVMMDFLWGLVAYAFDPLFLDMESGGLIFVVYFFFIFVILVLTYFIVRYIPIKAFRLVYYGVLALYLTLFSLVDVFLNPDWVSDDMPYAWLGGMLACGIFMALEAKDKMPGRRKTEV